MAGLIVIEKIEDFVDTVLNKVIFTLLSLSPSLAVMPSKNS